MTTVEITKEVKELQEALLTTVQALIIARDAIDDSENTDLPEWLLKILDQHSAMREAMARVRPKLRDEVVNDIYMQAQKTHKWNGDRSQALFMWSGSKAKVREAIEGLDQAYDNSESVRAVLDKVEGGWFTND